MFAAVIVAAVAVAGWLIFGADILSPDEDRGFEAIQVCMATAATEGYAAEPSLTFASGSGGDYEVTLQFDQVEVRCSAHHSRSGWSTDLVAG